MWEFSFGCVLDFDGVDIRIDYIFEVVGYCLIVDFWFGIVGFYVFGDVEDDVGEVILVDLDFLVVGNLFEFIDIGKFGGDVGGECVVE